MTYPEEAAVFPSEDMGASIYVPGRGFVPTKNANIVEPPQFVGRNYNIERAEFVLLADSMNHFLYDFEINGLSRVGTTFDGVLDGLMKRKRWDYVEDAWENVEWNGEEYDAHDYVPIWTRKYGKDGRLGEHVLIDPLSLCWAFEIDVGW